MLKNSECFHIDFDDGYDIKYFDIELNFYVHDGSGNKLPVTTTVECFYDPSPDEDNGESYFGAYINRLRFEGDSDEGSAYLELDGVTLKDLCPSLDYKLPPELDRFQVRLDVFVVGNSKGGGYCVVRVWIYQMVLVCKMV
jgi:hypothetical protein